MKASAMAKAAEGLAPAGVEAAQLEGARAQGAVPPLHRGHQLLSASAARPGRVAVRTQHRHPREALHPAQEFSA